MMKLRPLAPVSFVLAASLLGQPAVAQTLPTSKNAKPATVPAVVADPTYPKGLSMPWSDAGLPVVSANQPPEWAEVPRRLLVVYGHASKEKPNVYPMDTIAARRWQMILEWMGYECDYHHAAKGVPEDPNPKLYAGVIFDAVLDLAFEDEGAWTAWALKAFGSKQKLVFLGGFPFRDSFYANQLSQALMIQGMQSPPGVPKSVAISIKDPAMDFEAKVEARRPGFEHFQAPPDARVFLRITGTMQDGTLQNYDPIFAAPWGGAFMGSYMTFAASAEDQLSYVDPFALLAAIFPNVGNFPAPDVTTRCGQRVFFAHIDGDGFETLSTLPGGRTCAEEVRDRILKKYPFPVTISVIEAASRAVQEGLMPEKRESYEKLAIEIFNLPNIQSGSHAYSHPFVWIPNDPDSAGSYDRLNLELIPSENYNAIDPEREVAGSVAYISKTLLGGKPVEAMLWSGNCRAGEAAVASARRAGVESINGGDTIICKKHPAIAGVSARGIPWGREFQVFAANQNEYPYTKYWQGPFYGGFSQVTEAFEMTEHPRRLKPANIYFHFYSGRTGDSVGALVHAFSWAEEQPLHALKVPDYTKSVKAARAARVFQLKPGHWRLVAGPDCQTWRIPAKWGTPDMAACRGVLGWRVNGTERYIHTRGDAVTELVLAEKPAEHLFLAASSGPVSVQNLTPSSAKFSWKDFRPVLQQWEGLAPGTVVQWRQGKQKVQEITLGEDGILRLQLPADGEGELSSTVKQPK